MYCSVKTFTLDLAKRLQNGSRLKLNSFYFKKKPLSLLHITLLKFCFLLLMEEGAHKAFHFYTALTRKILIILENFLNVVRLNIKFK